MMIPVLDIFAGPGGLSEGFSSLTINGKRVFSVRLSIENEPGPFRTLKLRSFFRQFPIGEAPEDYYRLLRNEIDENRLYSAWPDQAKAAAHESWRITLGDCNQHRVDRRIRAVTKGYKNWVLIGGPPCQAYSNAGVVGNRTKRGYCAEKDLRYGLYKEYIRILAVHKPAAFVLENVPGMLSAQLNGKKIIDDLLFGLSNPSDFVCREFGEWQDAPIYRLISPVVGPQGLGCDPRVFIIRSEQYGFPQSRHRVIIIGIRQDGDPSKFCPIEPKPSVDMNSVVGDLPDVRSALSREPDSLKAWRSVFRGLKNERWIEQTRKKHGNELVNFIFNSAETIIKASPKNTGGLFVRSIGSPLWEPDWYIDPRLKGVCHHKARPHIRSDLHRYLFCSCFGALKGGSPKLPDFPDSLLPKHRNSNSGSFKDRFRVLIASRPSGTIISHLAKDGHAFIHPDPIQCRSLTPREAARLQTFPDNYFFFGGQTSIFKQIGNAVPPLLARLIAGAIFRVLST